MTVGEIIREIRKANHISQLELASAIMYDPKTISRIENNETEHPKKKTILAIGVALGLTLDQTNVLLRLNGCRLALDDKVDSIYAFVIHKTEAMCLAQRVDECNRLLSQCIEERKMNVNTKIENIKIGK